MRSVILALVLLTIPVQQPPPKLPPMPLEVFIGAQTYGKKPLAVYNTTECFLDGKLTDYYDIPDDTTDLSIIHIDAQRNKILRLEYVTRRDF